MSIRSLNISRKKDPIVISDRDSESSATASPIKSIKFFIFYFKQVKLSFKKTFKPRL